MTFLSHIKKHKHRYILLLIFLLALSLRLYFAFQNEYFEYDSYLELRQIEHIKQTFLPLIRDDLSYSGRVIITTPLYYYFLTFFNLFLPITLVGKLIPNILFSLLVIVVYLISYYLTKNKNISLLTSFISIPIPIFFSSSLFTLSAEPIIILLILVSLYCLMKINESEKYVNLFLIIAIILPLIHATSLLLVVGLLFYLFLTKIEGLNIKKSEKEVILFSTFFIAWTLFLIFKKAILLHGPFIIWQNLPQKILNIKFTTIDILKYIYYIGVVPLIFGAWSISRDVFKQKDLNSYKLISFAMALFLLLVLKLLDPVLGVSYIGIILVTLSSKIFLHISDYIEKTKAANFKKLIFGLIVLLFLLTSLISTINLTKSKLDKLPSKDEINLFKWLAISTNENDILLGSLKYGHAINSIAKRKNVFDNNFLYIENPAIRINDVKRIYQTSFEVDAVKLINKYNIKYILLTTKEKQDYQIKDLNYKDDKDCFELVYEKDQIKVYKFLECIIK